MTVRAIIALTGSDLDYQGDVAEVVLSVARLRGVKVFVSLGCTDHEQIEAMRQQCPLVSAWHVGEGTPAPWTDSTVSAPGGITVYGLVMLGLEPFIARIKALQI